MKEEIRNDLPMSDGDFEVTTRKTTIFTTAGNWLFAKRARMRSRKDSKKIMTEHRRKQAESAAAIWNQSSTAHEQAEDPTAIQKVRQHLEKGKSITVQECWRMFHTTELRMIISRLRKSMAIRDDWETGPDGKRYKRYFL